MGRNGLGGSVTIFCLKYRFKISGAKFSTSYVKERPHDDPDHVPKEPVGGDLEEEMVILLTKCRSQDLADWVIG